MTALGRGSGAGASNSAHPPIVADAVRRSWPTVSNDTISRLIQTSNVFDAQPGQTVLSETETPPRVALLARGTIAVTWSAPDGRTVYAGLYGPPHLVGVATLSGGPIAAGIDALTDVTLALWASRDLREIANADPTLALDLLDRSVFAVQAITHLLRVRTFTTAASRIAGLLLRYRAFCFSKAPLIPRSQLSALAGVSPRMVSTILRRWEAAGIVRRVGFAGLELIDQDGLEVVAEPLEAFPRPDPSAPGAWIVPTLEADHSTQ